MFALADCNNFYASAHRVFRPDLDHKPIVVLSNNDGCVIARSEEAKKFNIKMAVPLFQIQHLIDLYGITVFSSNYSLYGDMSSRIMMILQTFAPNVEIDSIDEAFLDFRGMELNFDLREYVKKIAYTVKRDTGMPVSIGMAKTKTLAKVASKFAKKYKNYHGVCVIDTDEKRIKALKLTKIGDVWGIGRKYRIFLEKMNIQTAYDFTRLPKEFIRKKMTVIGEKTWLELNGIPCIDLETEELPHKQICVSRAFSHSIKTLDELSEALSTYASLACEKLRKQKGCAVSVMVFIYTNNFRKDLPQYSRNAVVTLPVPTNSTLEIVKYVLKSLRLIYKPGYLYKKAAVIIHEIVPEDSVQANLFYNLDHKKHANLMKVFDKYNNGFEGNKIAIGVQGFERKWNMKQDYKSPCYTTKISDVIRIK